MDAGRISGNAVSTAFGAECAGRAAEIRPEQTAPQWETSCMLRISDEGYRKYEQALQTHQENIPHIEQAAAKPSNHNKKHSLDDAMTELTRFEEERTRILNHPDVITSKAIENERSYALKQVRGLWEEEEQDFVPDEHSEGDPEALVESKAGINGKMRQISRIVRRQVSVTEVSLNGAIDTIYEEARKNLTQARQDDHVLRNGLSALYRYVIRDQGLSAKDKTDAINRFVTEGRQALSKIENSLGYSLARLRSIRDIQEARRSRQDMTADTGETVSGPAIQSLLYSENDKAQGNDTVEALADRIQELLDQELPSKKSEAAPAAAHKTMTHRMDKQIAPQESRLQIAV